jgi:hypothetical protein
MSCVCFDHAGNIAVASSSGGLLNKTAGTIGETATVGAGTFVQCWEEPVQDVLASSSGSGLRRLTLGSFPVLSCLPILSPYTALLSDILSNVTDQGRDMWTRQNLIMRKRAVALAASGDTNTIIRASATLASAAMPHYTPGNMLLQDAVTHMVGPNGELQHSAGDNWGCGGSEGEAGMSWVEVTEDEHGRGSLWVGDDYNTAGLWRAAFNGSQPVVSVFR